MPIESPEETQALWGQYFDGGDLDSLVELYEANGALIPQPGAAALIGHDAIRAGLEQFISIKRTFSLSPKASVRSDDVAILYAEWKLTGEGPDGTPIELGGLTTDVARRQSDGGWLIAIDNPWGTAVAM